MSFSQEIAQQAPHMASMNPAWLVGGIGAAVGIALNARRATHHWHETINEGEVGVPLKNGRPRRLDGFSAEDIRLAEEADPFSTERHYKVKDEGFYLVWPRRTLQKVDVADQPATINLGLESGDKIGEKLQPQKLAIHANLTWHVSRVGDNPVRSITRVKHIKTDRKDHEAISPERHETGKLHPLECRVQAICIAGLGRVLSGRKAEELYRLTYLGETGEEQEHYNKLRSDIQEATIAQSRLDLIYYGVMLKRVELLPVVRTAEEVNAQALRTLSVFDAVAGAAVGIPENERIADNVTELPAQRGAAS